MALVGSYLDVSEFRTRTIAPEGLVDGDHIAPADTVDPVKLARRAAWRTFIEQRLVIETSRINARLRKRYAVPFASPTPEIVCGWLTAAVTVSVYEKRGWDPADEQAVQIIAARDVALEDQKEAADSADGLFDLPLRQDTTEEGISKGGPLGYSEASPYDWLDRQREAVRS